MDCLYCSTDHTVKNGKLPGGGQRWKCGDCDHQFTTGGKRGTYNPVYKEQIAREYCHTSMTAQEAVAKYHISSKTLIHWAKTHKKTCVSCMHT